ncbi:hypothetical protein CNR22_22155 [Sphingobacteriaceae bacterium]|nr:hypothetical protein CNR22_22155 [Sphingobacteriaceae bacterium]
MKLIFKITAFCLFIFFVSNFSSCKKDKLLKDASAKLEFSQDSVLFDTVFTGIGSATRNVRIRNTYNQKLKISSIQLLGGSASPFIINVDGAKGTNFTDLEIAAHDSMYIFVQVNVNPTNVNSPLIISDAIKFVVNGNEQTMILEAWGQDAYYHRPDSVIKFQDGSQFPYSVATAVPNSYNKVGDEIVWKNDKPHVIYGYLVVDEYQKLKILENTKVYLNYKAGIWVYAGGQIQVLGKKDKEVVFQGARREKDYADEAGQWDRIWINEGKANNIIDYAIIKNGYIGLQCEFLGDDVKYKDTAQLVLTNTKIQNMSYWGLYCKYFTVYANNTVISNCQEHSVNISLGGGYRFAHCTFANYWSKDKVREKATLSINNYNDVQTLPLNLVIANCIVDGKLENEVNLDIKTAVNTQVTYTFANCWLKTNINTTDPLNFINVRKGAKADVLEYKDIAVYNFEPLAKENRITNFTGPLAEQYAKYFGMPYVDINAKLRNTTSVTAGAYETQ